MQFSLRCELAGEAHDDSARRQLRLRVVFTLPRRYCRCFCRAPVSMACVAGSIKVHPTRIPRMRGRMFDDGEVLRIQLRYSPEYE